jgi:catechol 2,3-dioxygenase-like lactoylglutathione lyase family enzyme
VRETTFLEEMAKSTQRDFTTDACSGASMAEVKGIGGAFVLSEDPTRLAAWYRDVLGLQLERHSDGKGFYQVFFTRDRETSELRANPVFAIQPSDGKLAAQGRGFIVNLRVDDLAAFLAELEERDVATEPIVEDPYGLFSAVNDADGNRIELYEERFPDTP